MKKTISLLQRSTALKVILAFAIMNLCIMLDHITLQVFGFTLLLSWQSFAFAIMHKPNLSPLVPTIIGIIIDATSGTLLGYSSALLLVIQIAVLALYHSSRTTPLSQPFTISLIILATSIFDWILTCCMLGTWLSLTPALLSKIPATFTFPIFSFVATFILRALSHHVR